MMWGQNRVEANIMALQLLPGFESQLRHLLRNLNLSKLYFSRPRNGMTAFTS